MIYRVVLDDTYDLHTSDINCMLLNPSLELEMNSAGSFNFTLPPTHPYWDSIEILKSTIDVYEDDDLIFTGRVANIDKNWNNERVVECEGALAYFNDSIHRQMKWDTPLPIASEDPTVHNFLKDILDNHNVFVGNATNRQIHMGHIYVDPYLVTREVDYDTTLDILTRMCIDTNGGYFMIRKDPETHLLYLDWLKDFTEESGQPASFGVNLLDFNTGLHAADICTGVLARGATVNDQVVTLSNVELVDETTYPDMSVDHYTDHDQDILWHRDGMAKFGRVVQVHEFPDAQTDWKNDGQIVDNSLFEEAKKWLEEKNTKVESIEVEVAELSWLKEGVPKYKLGQIVEILDDAHMAGESYEVRHLPMYKLSCDLSSGSKKVTLGRPPKKELTQISASNSDSSTLSSGNSSGSSSGGGSGSGEECKVHDVRVDGTSVVTDKIANINLTGKADTSTVNALAAAVATKADASSVIALADVVSGKQDQIEFNTQEAATEVLTRLKADNKVYNLGGGTAGGIMMSDYYSEDEQVVGRWTDGKPLYQKTVHINGSFGPNVYDVTVFDASSLNIDNICFSFATFENGTPLPYAHPDIRWVANYYVDSNKIFKVCVGTSSTITNMVLTLQYTKTTDAPGTGPTKGNLIYLPALYSEEEREVGVWTDGKPLYQKTVKNIGVTLQQNTWTNTGISFAGVEHWEVIFNKSNSSDLDNQYPMLYRYYNGNFEAFCQYTMPLDELTIQYTKTTDQPGSGKYLPDGQLSHNYSTSEKVVGTWIDGSTLYERTWDLGSDMVGSANAWVDMRSYISTIPNCNFILDAKSMTSDGVSFHLDGAYNAGYLELRKSGQNWSGRYITIQYTKSS